MNKMLQQPTTDVLSLERSLEAFEESPEFRGPVETIGDNESNDHLASIYESREEQFSTVIPFVRQGLERGERCLYITDENDREAILDELRAADIDVDAALESGTLTMHTAQDTYLRNGTFDPDDMIAFISGIIDDARGAYPGVRITGEMTWILGDDPVLEDLVEYEGKLNRLFPETNCIALCQYNRERFPAEVIRDIIKTHPHLIYDGAVCQNFYYTPPEEFFGPEQPEREVDRMMGTLLDRTQARTELQDRQEHLQRQNEVTGDPDRSFDEKLQALFELGCERFGLELGAMARVDTGRDRFEIEAVSDDHEHVERGLELPLSETYCAAATAGDDTAGVSVTIEDGTATETGYEDTVVHREFGLRTYFGTHLEIDGDDDRTFFFVASESRSAPFTDDERTFLRLLAQWVTYELEQHHRERTLETSIERLETSNERLERFAYAASHDLQEPLRMVSSYLQLLERRYGDDLEPDAMEFLAYAVDGSERMREMIDALLEYSRIETRGEPLEPVDLEGVLGDVIDDLQVRIRETDAKITSDSLPRVRGDRNQLRQVCQNLLSNALTYSGDEPPRIHVAAERADGEWIVSVEDDGIGIEPENQDRVFEIFDRLHSREAYDGTGIGLALCERIVERHGGEIWLDSTPGEGSTFSVALQRPDDPPR
ncbi:MEDS domain-containing protein [Natrinema sp. 1APR25-10V2]|uniref:MEDS domain-containing protein n=1 Tax=Natrinema sp. 1APR25-10V2 TaxID=2951081 RepID=UPI00287660D7|nr:MEDS domain-containing protein [Natrinema sp. 1APR25-10V2]MDS0474480.1 MEDS domain-containing protein [Natrinema sp. 1APR25-10V2]